MLDVDGDGGPRKQSGRWWRGVLATHKHTGTGYTYLGKAMKVLSIRVPGNRAGGRYGIMDSAWRTAADETKAGLDRWLCFLSSPQIFNFFENN